MRIGLLRDFACGLVCTALSFTASATATEFTVLQIAPGVYCGPAPDNDQEYEHLQQLGVRTVLDMRKCRPLASSLEQENIHARGMLYRRIPVGFLPTHTGSPEEVLRLMSDPCCQPIYVHCSLGRDRTGLMVALYRVRYLGWDPQHAYAAMEEHQYNPLLRDLDRYFWQNAEQ